VRLLQRRTNSPSWGVSTPGRRLLRTRAAAERPQAVRVDVQRKGVCGQAPATAFSRLLRPWRDLRRSCRSCEVSQLDGRASGTAVVRVVGKGKGMHRRFDGGHIVYFPWHAKVYEAAPARTAARAHWMGAPV
jgi:hypothetical protein